MSPKATKITYWIANGLFALAMIFSSIGNVTGDPQTVTFIHDWLGYPEYFILFIGVLKIAGSIVILVPAFPRLKEWAYAGLCFDLVGAVYSVLSSGGTVAESWPMFIFVALAAFAYIMHIQKQKLDGKTF